MDAKKAAQVWKPIYLTDTKVFKYTNWAFAGLLGFSVALGGLFIYYRHYLKKPKEGFLRRLVREHFESETYRYQFGRLEGLYPPSKEYIKDLEERSARVNPITPSF